MKESVWGWWMIVLGLFIISIIILITDLTTTSEQDYYMTKEINEAAMLESVDYGYYRKYGELRISGEKYMENFIRRYSEVISINKTVHIKFYHISESPPKATVEVSTDISRSIFNSGTTSINIKNRLNGILEVNSKSKTPKE